MHEDSEGDYCFTISDIANTKEGTAVLTVGSVKVNALINSESTCNLMDMTTWKQPGQMRQQEDRETAVCHWPYTTNKDSWSLHQPNRMP